MEVDGSASSLASYADTTYLTSPGFSTKNASFYRVCTDSQTILMDGNPKVMVCLANWSTAALFGIAMCTASPIIIGVAGQKPLRGKNQQQKSGLWPNGETAPVPQVIPEAWYIA